MPPSGVGQRRADFPASDREEMGDSRAFFGIRTALPLTRKYFHGLIGPVSRFLSGMPHGKRRAGINRDGFEPNWTFYL
jgi:hypothetical protein